MPKYDKTKWEEQDIIRYRTTAKLRRPQIKRYTASNEGGGLQNQREQ